LYTLSLIEVLFMENAKSLPKAEWFQRLGAYIIDFFAAAITGYIVYLMQGEFSAWLLTFELFFLINFCVGWKIGQTIGMWFFKIQVITTEGKSLGWGRVFWRYIAFTISLFSIIGMVWIFFDKESQGLHDKLAETYVIKKI